jgi:uncharacterized protein (DUF2252 family)
MNIVKATKKYEDWLSARTNVVQSDLRLKHQRMAAEVFPFFRATFYRWMQLWPEVCAALNNAPRVLAVGDLHVENFGTWRDVEGRLVWGVNDFDEAFPLPYAVDLVRLVASAMLAVEAGHANIKPDEICEEALNGYNQALADRGKPFVLEEEYPWLRQVAVTTLRDPEHFWKKLTALPVVRGEISASVRKALEQALPGRGLQYRVMHRIAGLGSLGRQRFVALAEFDGAKVAREAKALLPSAVYWAQGTRSTAKIYYEAITENAVRCADPFLCVRKKWVVRRLSPYCSRIELAMLPANREDCRLLSSMGYETGNIHLGTPKAIKAVQNHLKGQKADWLRKAASEMVNAVKKDWDEWRKASRG